ncbi:uncharacterized protein A1O9_02257 [Exophiala aquamarina CBS 119918]|uniref:Pathogenesis associated protein Cap20 n=1 Tax=Exophiala aquamarina CBS 119918 TaxID=1182545 RepID=A0A072PLE9_9EURO|nr:uncharacterized protein A1O9_02257 [Exophiala aquamarina CBS 119918]KEF60696.1 hypothetical protein A1O9_02257 [Exophiala aquamarina CBS 119918]
MGDATANGDVPHSAFFTHITSYPVVSDSIKLVQENPYGAKSIDLTNAGYSKFVKPTLPYFQTPASYAKPYVAKADELGDLFLSKFDERVPIVKSETKEIKGTIFSYVHWPLEKAGETKDWAFSTYNEEYKKIGGDGYVTGGKAVVTTSLILTSDALKWVSSFLQAKKDEAKDVVQEKTSK